MTEKQIPPAAVTFVGPIYHPATKNLRNLCSQLGGNGTPELHLFLSSTGGSLAEGFALYNFLRSLPLELTTHNIGSIESVANVVFLAADQRCAAPDTHFLLHGFDWTFSAQTTLVQRYLIRLNNNYNKYQKSIPNGIK